MLKLNISEKTEAPFPLANRSLFLLAVLLCFLPFKSFADNVVGQLHQKIKAVKTMQGHLQIENMFKNKSISANGDLDAVSPDFFRMDLETRLQTGKERPVNVSTQVILDGKHFWLLVKRENSPPFIGTFNFKKLEKDFPNSYYDPADQLDELKEGTIKVVGQTLLDGKPVYIISGKPKREVPVTLLDFDLKKENMPAHVTLWIGQEDGITYQSVMQDAAGKKVGAVHFTSVIVNQPIAPEKFRFKPPDDLPPVDLTPMIEEELQKHGVKKH